MHKRIATGLFVLIFILGVAIVFYHQYTDIQQLKQEAAEAEKLLEEQDKPVVENKPPVAREGFKMVPHGDHWHEVPMDAPNTQQEQPVTKEVQAKPAYTGPLTFHEELLKTNPVEALRLQAEERGHWSAEWIPTFDPGDQEAEAIARSLYIRHYYKSIGDTDNPIYIKAGDELMLQSNAIGEHPSAKRRMDLLRLTWTHLSSEHAVTRVSPSNHNLPRK